MERPWTPEGEQTRCRLHGTLFARGRSCAGCLSAPPVVAEEPSHEAEFHALLLADRDWYAAQRDHWTRLERSLTEQIGADTTERGNLQLVKAAAIAADVSRKATVAHTELVKLLRRSARTEAMRKERLETRRGTSH